jgi:thiosulfate dehydrogenase [quinone] large subunit
VLANKTPGFWFGFLRIVVGFSWLINGLDKILNPSYESTSLRPLLETWSASAQGALGAFVGSSLLPHVEIVGFVLKAGEVLIGLALITGVFGRLAAFGGLVIVTGAWLFKDAYDALPGYGGADFIVMATMLFLTVAPSVSILQMDRILIRNRPVRSDVIVTPPPAPTVAPTAVTATYESPPPSVGTPV